jgi:hypothetical protein
MPSVQDLEKMKVIELKEFLKSRNVKNSGNKFELLRMARLYVNHPVINLDQGTGVPCQIWESATEWKDVSTFSLSIPSAFSIASINAYLSCLLVSLSARAKEGEEEVDDENEDDTEAGTRKPVVKGRQMYQSEKLTLAEWACLDNGTFLFRGNCEASLKKQMCRYPRVSVSASGGIEHAECTCEAAEDGRCCHVAALLYLVEDLSFGVRPRIRATSTSTTQYWGRGRVLGNDPKPIYTHQYSKRRKTGAHRKKNKFHSFSN